MRYKPLPLLLFLCFSIGAIQAQITSNTYIPVQCEGQIPQSILRSVVEKSNEQSSKIDENASRKERKKMEEFYSQVNHVLDQTLISGNVLFGDTITRYISKIGDELLKSQPILRSEIEFFTYKSPYVNAFATDQGYLMVNVGLIAQVSNEAELAYVMSHEIIHFREKHVTKEYIESQVMRRDEGKYRETSQTEKINSLYQYSRDLEFEADKEGLKLLSKSRYDPLQAKGIFDVLLYSYLPFDEEPFDISYLGNENFEFPGKLQLDSTKTIETVEDVDDSQSSHPNIKKRKKATYKYFKKMVGKTDNKMSYIASREEFEYIRELARFEVIRQNIIEHRYDRAIYNIYVMEKKYPNNLFLKQCLSMAMEGALQYKEKGESSLAMSHYKNVEGQSQRVSYFLRKSSRRDLAVLVCAKTYEGLKAFPNDPYLKKALDRQLYHMLSHYSMEPDDFISVLDEPNQEIEDPEDVDEKEEKDDSSKTKKTSGEQLDVEAIFADDETEYVEEDEDQKEEVKDSELHEFFNSKYDKDEKSDSEGKGKYEKIKKASKFTGLRASILSRDYRKVVFYDYLAEEKFKEALEEAYDRIPEEMTHAQKRIKYKTELKENRVKKKRGVSLGISNIAIAQPIYYVIDDRGSAPRVLFVESLEKRKKFEENTAAISKEIGINAQLLNPKNVHEDDVDNFNTIMKLKEWTAEFQSSAVDSPITRIAAELKGMDNVLGVSHVVVPEIYTVKTYESKGAYAWSMLYLVTIPWAIVNMATNPKVTYCKFHVIDLDKGKEDQSFEYVFEGADSQSILNTCMYNTLVQIRRTHQ